nr:PREDICTED: uncharacterized protein LOC102365307 isoform X1 [Latimeria chalumnae]|eukprot:XP_006013879.1 PREDICTED: uncharacterized protein LOC102365307 isoform X1 [Latimeria chalumnae]
MTFLIFHAIGAKFKMISDPEKMDEKQGDSASSPSCKISELLLSLAVMKKQQQNLYSEVKHLMALKKVGRPFFHRMVTTAKKKNGSKTESRSLHSYLVDECVHVSPVFYKQTSESKGVIAKQKTFRNGKVLNKTNGSSKAQDAQKPSSKIKNQTSTSVQPQKNLVTVPYVAAGKSLHPSWSVKLIQETFQTKEISSKKLYFRTRKSSMKMPSPQALHSQPAELAVSPEAGNVKYFDDLKDLQFKLFKGALTNKNENPGISRKEEIYKFQKMPRKKEKYHQDYSIPLINIKELCFQYV